jgi:hypothetical protein
VPFRRCGQPEKAKGRPPLRELALSSDVSKIRIGIQITTNHNFRSVRTCALSPAFLYPSSVRPSYELSWSHPNASSFLNTFVSSVAGSPDGPCPLSSLEDFSSVDLDISSDRSKR